MTTLWLAIFIKIIVLFSSKTIQVVNDFLISNDSFIHVRVRILALKKSHKVEIPVNPWKKFTSKYAWKMGIVGWYEYFHRRKSRHVTIIFHHLINEQFLLSEYNMNIIQVQMEENVYSVRNVLFLQTIDVINKPWANGMK